MVKYKKKENKPKEEEWINTMFDIEAAFLEPKLTNKIYIEIPEAMVAMGYCTEEERHT